jgi:hypothetical protein
MSPTKAPMRSDGREFSPVIRANCKFCKSGGVFFVDVRFNNIDQLDALIAALKRLRDFPPHGFDHIHLQDASGRALLSQAHSAEITFSHPSVKRSSGIRDCVANAKRFFESPHVPWSA